MTDRLHSPSGWGGVPVTPGQHVLPGSDFRREVPLPPQPPLEDDFPCCTHRCEMPACGMEGDDCQHGPRVKLVRFENVKVSRAMLGESPDLPIPTEAVEDGAAAYWERMRYAPAEPDWAGLVAKDPVDAEVYRDAARAILAAALPHLRSLQVETQVAFGRALGRKEAAEEIAAAIEVRRDDHTWSHDRDGGLTTAAGIARDLGKGDPGD